MAKMTRRKLRQMIMENINEAMIDDIRQGLGLDSSYSDSVVERLPRVGAGGLFSDSIRDHLLKALAAPVGSSGAGAMDRLSMLEIKVKEVLADLMDEVLKETQS